MQTYDDFLQFINQECQDAQICRILNTSPHHRNLLFSVKIAQGHTFVKKNRLEMPAYMSKLLGVMANIKHPKFTAP